MNAGQLESTVSVMKTAASLSEHPKAAIQEHLKSGHTFRRDVQDIDSSGRVSSLSQHGECLEGRKETANHSLGTTGMVSAKKRLIVQRRCGSILFAFVKHPCPESTNSSGTV